jgi:hypothetical protein
MSQAPNYKPHYAKAVCAHFRKLRNMNQIWGGSTSKIKIPRIMSPAKGFSSISKIRNKNSAPPDINSQVHKISDPAEATN